MQIQMFKHFNRWQWGLMRKVGEVDSATRLEAFQDLSTFTHFGYWTLQGTALKLGQDRLGW